MRQKLFGINKSKKVAENSDLIIAMFDNSTDLNKEEAENSVNKIISNMEESSYYKYKIYIMREEDTLESIAIKYNVSLENLREYNDLENINIGDKIIIPIISNDKQD